MKSARQGILLSDIDNYERRFDGPVPPYILYHGTSRFSRLANARNLIARIAYGHRRDVWTHLEKTRRAMLNSDIVLAKFYRTRLDAAARSLASMVSPS